MQEAAPFCAAGSIAQLRYPQTQLPVQPSDEQLLEAMN